MRFCAADECNGHRASQVGSSRNPRVIVVATADFELYHGVVTELRDRGVTFTTIEPGERAREVLVALAGMSDRLESEQQPSDSCQE